MGIPTMSTEIDKHTRLRCHSQSITWPSWQGKRNPRPSGSILSNKRRFSNSGSNYVWGLLLEVEATLGAIQHRIPATKFLSPHPRNGMKTQTSTNLSSPSPAQGLSPLMPTGLHTSSEVLQFNCTALDILLYPNACHLQSIMNGSQDREKTVSKPPAIC